MIKTACPLDCYDACEIVYEEGKLRGSKFGYTQGYLCTHLNHYQKHQTIQKPRLNGSEISMNEALEALKSMLRESEPNEILHYRGSGNFALMQEVSDHFFASLGATLTNGTLCDGAGEAGIEEGRGSNKNMPLGEIVKSEVVIFWGRNPHTTTSHLLPLIKGKTIIVIDPVKTQIAKSAALHIQLRPHSDLELALLLCRFLHIENSYDKEFLDSYASGYEEFYGLTQSVRIKSTLDKIDVSLGQIGDVLHLVKDKKVAIVCGVGVQKYRDGADVLRAIDAFAAMLGLFGKEGCGVSYLGSSRANITSPFNTQKAKRVSKVDTDFSKFKTVFIQGSNPLNQMPNALRVRESISNVKNIVYFGLHENETSKVANLVIPAKSFLYKNDIRTSYGHNGISFMPKVEDSVIGISEYDLSAYLCGEFGFEIESEKFYIEHFMSYAVSKDNGTYEVRGRENIPYKDGFDTDDREFAFLDELDLDDSVDDKFFLITSKNLTSLNSQFYPKEFVYLHSSLGYAEDEEVEVSSCDGSVRLKVRHNDDLRSDCVLIYSGTNGVNNLTTSKRSFSGNSAIFQENKVDIKR